MVYQASFHDLLMMVMLGVTNKHIYNIYKLVLFLPQFVRKPCLSFSLQVILNFLAQYSTENELGVFFSDILIGKGEYSS